MKIGFTLQNRTWVRNPEYMQVAFVLQILVDKRNSTVILLLAYFNSAIRVSPH